MEGWVTLHKFNGEELYIRPQAVHAVTPPGGDCVPSVQARVYIPVDDLGVRETPEEVLALIAKAMPRRQVAVPMPKGLITPR